MQFISWVFEDRLKITLDQGGGGRGGVGFLLDVPTMHFDQLQVTWNLESHICITMHNHLQLVKGCNFRLKSIDGDSHCGPSKPSIIFVLFQALIRYLTIGYSKICWLIMMYHTISHDAKVSVCGHRMSGQWPAWRFSNSKPPAHICDSTYQHLHKISDALISYNLIRSD